ncbi:MAG: pyridoxal phosphate-dependent aminotransferase [Bacteroidota bacterium]|nr:pyridoxal phosphate-dependent aminotransferase [Bacteroidota bacterium]
MTHLSDRINRLSESQTIAMARRSRELIAQGIDIISLSLGEPDFKTPEVIKKAAKDAIDHDFSYYTHVSGYLELRQAIAQKFERDNGLKYTADQIVVSTGAKQSIANVVLSLINPGDEVLVPMPYWVSYVELVKLAEGVPVIINTSIENDFKVTAEQIAAAITPKTRLLMFSTPCNPTGTVYSKEELRAIAEVIAKQPECYIMADEIYEHINFIGSHQSIAQFDFIYDRVATINGVSKGFAMTGWRGGILAAPLWLAKACDKMQGQFTSATSSITQKAMHAAMLMDPTSTYELRDAFKRRRDLMLNAMKDIPGMKLNVPEGAFYLFPDVRAFFGKRFGETVINNATDLSLYLLDQAHVAIVPGAAFGDDNYIRISYATADEKLVEAARRMKEALAKLS